MNNTQIASGPKANESNPALASPSSRLSIESDQYSLTEDDPASLSSATLLADSKHKPRLSKQSKALLKTSAVNLLWILMWYTFATFLSVYNKWMFSEEHYNFHYPLFVTSIHMVVQFFFAGLSVLIVPRLRPTTTPKPSEYILKILPCALATSLDIGLSNLSLKTITLSFYTMCKSSTLAFVLIFAFLFRLEKPSFKLVGIILIIVTGVVLMVSNETDFELVGFIAVMTASACGGIRWALTELLLRKESMGLTNPFASILFLAPAQAVILLIISAGAEGFPTIFNSVFFITPLEGFHTILVILFGGTLAFFMIVSEFFLIKRTSVVTLSVCGIFKEVATIFLSTVIFGDHLTVINIVGLCITLFGIGLYNWLKIRRITQQAKEDSRNEHLDEQMLEDDHEYVRTSSRRAADKHLYTMVAESTPILLVDGAMTSYKDVDTDSDSDSDYYDSDRRRDQFELRSTSQS